MTGTAPGTQPEATPRGRRLTRDDWTEAATEALASGGLAAIAVEPLAERLGVTKGSFYSHFSSRRELVAAVLARWRELDTTVVLAELHTIENPRDRIIRYLDLTFRRRRWGQVYAALCASAADPLVEPAMARVREQRLAYLQQALVELGLSATTARDHATLIYSTYIGYWRLLAADPDWDYNRTEEARRFATHLCSVLVPAA